jgi:hypothetical protein
MFGSKERSDGRPATGMVRVGRWVFEFGQIRTELEQSNSK